MSSPISPPSTSSPRSSPSSFGSDDSSIIDMSFDYKFDENGNFVRISKGSSKSPKSTPSTPPQDADTIGSLASSAPAVSTIEANKATHRRASLSRSESMPSDSLAVPSSHPLIRAVSGPIPTASTTPMQTTRTIAPLSTGLQGTARKLTGGAQRIRREEAERQRREIEERNKRDLEEAERERARRAMEEKENALLERHSPPHNHARPIASLPSRQYNFPRSIRPLLTSIKSSTITKINEVETSEGESEDQVYNNNGIANVPTNQQYSHYSVGVNKLRTSPVENTDPHDPSYLPASRLQPQSIPLPVSRPGSSLGTVSRVRRVTLEEKLRQEREIAAEEAQEMLERERIERDENPSPTHVSSIRSQQSQTRATHQRRDSDTLRIASAVQAARQEREDVRLQEQQQYYQEQYVEQEQPHAPQRYPQNTSPTGRSGGTVTLVNSQSGQPLRHKRSPTAPEAPTTSSSLALPNGNTREALKTWTNGDKISEKQEGGTVYPSKAEQVAAQRAQHQALQQAQQSSEAKSSRHFFVNKKQYARLDMIGKGGSSRVFRVITTNNEIYALKKVSLDKSDNETISGYMNEIQLLKRLEGNQRIIRLIDSEIKSSSVANKGNLLLVMECGEVDLARLLLEQQKEPMNMVWIAYYWQQMLQAVQVIHDEKIVHSDLKPANFVLVKGQLKLIDFGIANAIASDTTNIQRDHQIGTVNYMSPEAIEVPEGMRRLKVGRPSDVWSLGCILYQMVYGHPPFYNLSVMQKMKYIPDVNWIIKFPDETVPSLPAPKSATSTTPSPPKQTLPHLKRKVRADVIATMQTCLNRNPKERATIPHLLEDDWLMMSEGGSEKKKKEKQEQPRELQLAEDESLINPYFMKQLLQHAIRCAKQRTVDPTDEEQEEEARKLVQELKSMYAPMPSRH